MRPLVEVLRTPVVIVSSRLAIFAVMVASVLTVWGNCGYSDECCMTILASLSVDRLPPVYLLGRSTLPK